MIKMECLSPKRAKGAYDFAEHEEFALWVIANIRSGKTKVGAMLRTLAKRGELITTNIGCDIHAASDFFIKDYVVEKELERKTGMIKAGAGGDVLNSDPEAAMNFARGLDKLALRQEDNP